MENSKSYKEKIKSFTPKSHVLKDCSLAFIFGGTICLFGELCANLFTYFGANEKEAYLLVTCTLITISAILTGLGVFDRIARFAGAGTLVPVTGFANSVVSPAIDTRSEGLILGVGAKIFTISGPVILYAIISGTILGIIYYLVGIFS